MGRFKRILGLEKKEKQEQHSVHREVFEGFRMSEQEETFALSPELGGVCMTIFACWRSKRYLNEILGRFGRILGLEKRRQRNKILCVWTFENNCGVGGHPTRSGVNNHNCVTSCRL